MMNYLASPVLLNVLIANNMVLGTLSSNGGGAIYNYQNSFPVLTNVTIANNTAAYGGGAIYNSGSSMDLNNCIVWGNTASMANEIRNVSGTISFNYSLYGNSVGDITGTVNSINSITVDPLFTDSSNGNYTLQMNGPAINAGDNDLYLNAGGNLQFGLDVAGKPRVYNYTYEFANWGFVDMGAYEYQGAETTYVYQNDGSGWLLPMGDPHDIANTSDFHDDILIQSGTVNFTEEMKVNNLTIESGANLNIEGALMMWKDIINNGSIIFKSTATTLGQLGYMGRSTITGTGTITSERFIPARDDGKGAWRFLTSSMNSTGSIHANWQEGATEIGDNPNPGYGIFITGSTDGSNGFDATGAGVPSMFTYTNLNNINEEYTAVTNTNVDQLQAGQPYSVYVWGDRSVDILTSNDPVATNTTLRTTGSFWFGEYEQPLSEIGGSFCLIGNPYQAITDMNYVTIASNNVSIFQYYVWDPNIGTRGAYATVALPMGNPTPSDSDANMYLMPGQAAWVLTESNGPASIKFEEISKTVTVDPTNVFRNAGTELASIELQLFQANRFSNGQSLSDAVKINFSEGENNSVQSNDAPKMTNLDENLSRKNGDTSLSIENRSLPLDREILPLLIKQYRTINYVFSANVNNLPEGTIAYLQDNYLNSKSKLANNQVTPMQFSINPSILASIAEDRFSIVFKRSEMEINENSLLGLSIYPNPVENGEFFIVAPTLSGEKVQVSLYNTLGQKVFSSENTVNSDERVKVSISSLQSGIYMVEMKGNEKVSTGKVIVE